MTSHRSLDKPKSRSTMAYSIVSISVYIDSSSNWFDINDLLDKDIGVTFIKPNTVLVKKQDYKLYVKR